ncbi:hypothetical protein DSM104299_04291 [Baekduia alba]|uniref:hypothetical protein n=1 Tax=Baekduia alba TaxID=2997333 RepID=UPI00233FB578|nr:hypothetical protein [Baekduia alba]WCB95542.1 hypothetical protein DSM104299_04291 [Baekduia alba]
MSSVRVAEPSAGVRGNPRPAPRRRRDSPWTWVAALYVGAVVVYGVLALRTPLPVLFPDEFRYAHIARDGLGWRGEPLGQTARLYVFFIKPAWAVFDSTVDAWRASKLLGTLALCTQVVPVWWLAREMVGPRLALAPAALTVLGTWMLSSAETATEALAFPLTTAALCLLAMGLRRAGGASGSWLPWAALGLVVLATAARIQMAALIPAVLVVLLLDVVRDPQSRALRLHAHRRPLGVLGLAFAVLVVVALADPGIAGDYSSVFSYRPSLGTILSKTGLQLLELVATAGFAPVLLAAAAACSPAAWRDDDSGPLLAVFWPVALVTVVQSGFFLAGYGGAPWAIGRYITYALPIAFVLATVVITRPALLTRASLVAGALPALALVLRPAIAMIGEERGSWAVAYRVHQVLGLGAGPALLLVGLIMAAVVVVALRRAAGGDPMRAAALALGATAVVLLVQSQAAWWQMDKTGDSFRSVMPSDLQWVDHHASGPLALLAITQNAPQFDDIDYFNKQVTQAYVPEQPLLGRGIQGKRCTFKFTLTGALSAQRGCGPLPRRFLINDPSARVRFRDEVASATDRWTGRVVEIAPHAPVRARSLAILPCPRRTPGYSAASPDIVPVDSPITCSRELTVALWLDAPGTLAVRYRGGRTPQTVELAGRTFDIAPNTITTVRVAVPKGYTQQRALQSWTSSVASPTVAGITLTGADTGGKPMSLSW